MNFIALLFNIHLNRHCCSDYTLVSYGFRSKEQYKDIFLYILGEKIGLENQSLMAALILALLAKAPVTSFQSVAKTGLSVSFPTLHLGVMNRAQLAIAISILAKTGIGHILMCSKIGEHQTGLLKQVFTIFTTQGDLADKASWGYVSGIPTCVCF
jgi:hypothetical protein